MAGPGRLLLAGAALCAAQAAVGSERRAVTIGATVIAASQCRVDATTGVRCSGSRAAPQVATASATPTSQTPFQGQTVVRLSAASASLDSRQAFAPRFERVVLTIAP